jgi:hypothetical protein
MKTRGARKIKERNQPSVELFLTKLVSHEQESAVQGKFFHGWRTSCLINMDGKNLPPCRAFRGEKLFERFSWAL